MQLEMIGRVLALLGYSPKSSLSPTTLEYVKIYPIEDGDNGLRVAQVTAVFSRPVADEPEFLGLVVTEQRHVSIERAASPDAGFGDYCAKDMAAMLAALSEDQSGEVSVIECTGCGRAVAEFMGTECFECAGVLG